MFSHVRFVNWPWLQLDRLQPDRLETAARHDEDALTNIFVNNDNSTSGA
jgi:hypothetical protein